MVSRYLESIREVGRKVRSTIYPRIAVKLQLGNLVPRCARGFPAVPPWSLLPPKWKSNKQHAGSVKTEVCPWRSSCPWFIWLATGILGFISVASLLHALGLFVASSTPFEYVRSRWTILLLSSLGPLHKDTSGPGVAEG
jgi:hypothetical protein